MPETGPPLPAPYVEDLAPGIYAYIQPDGGWWVNNTGFVVGDDGVLSVDACSTERRTLAYLETIEKMAGRRPTSLVNTHAHGDHTNGNCLMAEATIIGHDRCREAMLQTGIMRPDGIWEAVEWGDLEVAPPSVTFEHRMNLYVGDLLVELHHFGTAAHTTGDVVAWIPEHKVLFAGDLVLNGGTPFVVMGSVSGSLVALDCLARFDAEAVVPGHGPLCNMSALTPVGSYLRFVQDLARDAMAAGLSPLDAARQADLGEFAALMHPERLAGNLHRAYAERNGARPGDPIDLLGAVSDMVTFNGGKPLHCSA